MSIEQESFLHSRQSGQAATEFILAFAVFVPLTLCTIQTALIMIAQLAVDYAAYSAARVGIVHNGDREKMERAARLICAFIQQEAMFSSAASTSQGALPPRQGRVNTVAELPWIESISEVDHLHNLTRMEILSPTKEMFQDFGEQDGIPFDAIDNEFHGEQSEIKITDANILKVKVIHSFPLLVPVANAIFSKLFSLQGDSSPSLSAPQSSPFERYRVPLEGYATLRMQSDPVSSLLGIEP